jgi:hypothetical protein
MTARLANLWDRLAGSFWFLPTMILLAAMLLGILLPVSENERWIRVSGGDWLQTTPIEKTMGAGRHLSEDLQQIREKLDCVADVLAGNRRPHWGRELPSCLPGKAVGRPNDKAANTGGDVDP